MELMDLVSQIKDQIIYDVENGFVPNDVESFSELHDYVDANMYGLEDDEEDWGDAETDPNEWADMINAAQGIVDDWIRDGNLENFGPEK